MYTCPMHPEVESEKPGICPKCGMTLERRDVAPAEEHDHGERRDMEQRFRVGVIFSIPVLALSMSEVVPGLRNVVPSTASRWVQFALATPVVMWGGWPLFVRGRQSIVMHSLNMFTLIALGTGVAYVYSVFAMLFPQMFPSSMRPMGIGPAIYFEAAAVITTLVLLGQVLELRARGQTNAAIRALLNLAPKSARRIRPDGLEEDVPLADVRVGDHLRIRPGEKVPTDGAVIAGISNVCARLRCTVMRSLLFFVLLALSPAAVLAQAPKPVTLHDAIASALTTSGIDAARVTVRSGQRAASNATASPQLSGRVAFGIAPQLPGSAQTNLTEQLGVDFGSAGTRRGQLLLARANAAQARAMLLQSRITVMQSAALAFFAVASDQSQLEAANESVALGERSLQAAQDRHRVGLAPLVDVERARAALASAQADQAATLAAMNGDRESLASVIGASSRIVELPRLTPIPSVDQITTLAPPASPPTVLARASLDTARASELLARGALQPALTVGAGVSQLRQAGIGSNGPALNAGLNFPRLEHRACDGERGTCPKCGSAYRIRCAFKRRGSQRTRGACASG